jgi:hypothetical protein
MNINLLPQAPLSSIVKIFVVFRSFINSR